MTTDPFAPPASDDVEGGVRTSGFRIAIECGILLFFQQLAVWLVMIGFAWAVELFGYWLFLAGANTVANLLGARFWVPGLRTRHPDDPSALRRVLIPFFGLSFVWYSVKAAIWGSGEQWLNVDVTIVSAVTWALGTFWGVAWGTRVVPAAPRDGRPTGHRPPPPEEIDPWQEARDDPRYDARDEG